MLIVLVILQLQFHFLSSFRIFSVNAKKLRNVGTNNVRKLEYSSEAIEIFNKFEDIKPWFKQSPNEFRSIPTDVTINGLTYDIEYTTTIQQSSTSVSLKTDISDIRRLEVFFPVLTSEKHKNVDTCIVELFDKICEYNFRYMIIRLDNESEIYQILSLIDFNKYGYEVMPLNEETCKIANETLKYINIMKQLKFVKEFRQICIENEI